jgi:hypothetical protein
VFDYTFEDCEAIRSFSHMFRPRLCDTCTELQEQENHRLDQERRAAEYAERTAAARERAGRILSDRIPPRYLATDTSHPAFNRRLWDKVKTWQPTSDKPWLGLIGASGTCKTRVGFLLLREYVMRNIRGDSSGPFEIATAYELATAVRDQYDRKMLTLNTTVGEKARSFLDRVTNADILLLDDLGKAKATPAVAAELFSIIDQRHARNLPTLWTANSNPEVIAQGMSEDMAGPFAGRLLDCSTIIRL